MNEHFDGPCVGGPYDGETKDYWQETMPVYWQEGVFVHTGVYTFVGTKWRYSGPPHRSPASIVTSHHHSG